MTKPEDDEDTGFNLGSKDLKDSSVEEQPPRTKGHAFCLSQINHKDEEHQNPIEVTLPISTGGTDAPLAQPPPPPPPDGGLNAWTQVLMSHLINFNTFGYTGSFGIFQAYYTESLGLEPSKVSWIGTINLFLIYLGGTVSGRAMDGGYYRLVLICGLSLQLVATFTTSVCRSYWQLLLAQGVCQGIGNGLLFCPAVALVATYFSPKRRAFAVSCVAAGGGTGGMVFPAIAQSLLSRIGFGWTLRVMGFVMLFNTILILTFSRTRLPPKPAEPLFDWSAFRERSFNLYCIGVFLIFWGLWLVYYYIRPYGLDVIHVSEKTSFNLILVLNGMGVPGRMIPAIVSDKFFGPVNVLLPSAVVLGLLFFCWIAVDSIAGLYVFDFFYGFFAGAAQALFLATCSSFTPDLRKVGARTGLIFAVVSLSGLSGPPIGGALVSMHGGRYLTLQVFGGTVVMCGCVALFAGRIAHTGLNLKQRF